MILLCGFFFIKQIDTLWIAMWIVVWMSAGVIHPARDGPQAGKTARLSTSLACLTHKISVRLWKLCSTLSIQHVIFLWITEDLTAALGYDPRFTILI